MSDHCCIDFSFDFSIEYDENVEFEDTEQISIRYVWNGDSKEEFINRLQQPSSRIKFRYNRLSR